MRIIGVVDLRNGQAVHAAGGRRDAYAPVAAAAGVRVAGDAMALGRAGRELVVGQFSTRTKVDRMEALYRRLLTAR